MPRLRSSSTDLKGCSERAWMISAAVTGPMPGSDSRAAWSAVFRSMRSSPASERGAAVRAELGDDDLEAVAEWLREVQRKARRGEIDARPEATCGLDGITDAVSDTQSHETRPCHRTSDVHDDPGAQGGRSAVVCGKPGRCQARCRHGYRAAGAIQRLTEAGREATARRASRDAAHDDEQGRSDGSAADG